LTTPIFYANIVGVVLEEVFREIRTLRGKKTMKQKSGNQQGPTGPTLTNLVVFAVIFIFITAAVSKAALMAKEARERAFTVDLPTLESEFLSFQNGQSVFRIQDIAGWIYKNGSGCFVYLKSENQIEVNVASNSSLIGGRASVKKPYVHLSGTNCGEIAYKMRHLEQLRTEKADGLASRL